MGANSATQKFAFHLGARGFLAGILLVWAISTCAEPLALYFVPNKSAQIQLIRRVIVSLLVGVMTWKRLYERRWSAHWMWLYWASVAFFILVKQISFRAFPSVALIPMVVAYPLLVGGALLPLAIAF